jgi:PHS family inorganic phosphate transporter-like MFS transporter
VKRTCNIFLKHPEYKAFESFTDGASFGWFDFDVFVIAGVGFFTEPYSIFSINFCTAILGILIWANFDKDQFPSTINTAIEIASFGGAIIGQLGSGYLADVVGRKRIYGLELITIIIVTLAQLWSPPSISASPIGRLIILWRVLLGQCFVVLIVKYPY